MEAAEIEDHVKELETRLDRLRALYEQYFMGIERLEPQVPRKDVERRFQLLRKEQIRNTAVRFRFQMALQKYNTYQSHWMRICRQIEEGTYKRDVLRAKARLEGQGRRERTEDEGPTAFDVSDGLSALDEVAPTETAAPLPRAGSSPDLAHARAPSSPDLAAAAAATAKPADAPKGFGSPPKASQSKMRMLAVRLKAEKEAAATRAASGLVVERPKSTPPPASRPEPPPAAPPHEIARVPAAVPAAARAAAARSHGDGQGAASPSGSRPDLSDERVRQLYGQYVETRRKHNESTATLTLEGMARTLRESSAKLREKHGKSVDFEVTVKDGKTVLKPVVR